MIVLKVVAKMFLHIWLIPNCHVCNWSPSICAYCRYQTKLVGMCYILCEMRTFARHQECSSFLRVVTLRPKAFSSMFYTTWLFVVWWSINGITRVAFYVPQMFWEIYVLAVLIVWRDCYVSYFIWSWIGCKWLSYLYYPNPWCSCCH